MFVGYGRGLTAFYTSVVLHKPRAIPRLLALVPRALRDLASPSGDRLGDLGDDFPRQLIRANLRGMLQGPVMYLRARVRARQLRRGTAQQRPAPRSGAGRDGVRDISLAGDPSRTLTTARLGIGGSALASALALAQIGHGSSLVGILAIALFGLGPAVTCWLDTGDNAAQLALTVALSLAAFALCSAVLVWLAFWHPMLLVLLSVPTVVSCALRLRRPSSDRPRAAASPEARDAIGWPFL